MPSFVGVLLWLGLWLTLGALLARRAWVRRPANAVIGFALVRFVLNTAIGPRDEVPWGLRFGIALGSVLVGGILSALIFGLFVSSSQIEIGVASLFLSIPTVFGLYELAKLT